MTKHLTLTVLTLAAIFSMVDLAMAHSGGLDARGGHYNRKTGVYHCHTASCERRISNQDRRRICNYGHGRKNCTREELRYGY